MKRLAEILQQTWARPEGRFVVLFLVLLSLSFGLVALQPVNDAVVVPFTTLVARASGGLLSLLGEEMTVTGCQLRSPRFAVTIYNGCNGLVTSLIFLSAVLAFPAPWRAKLLGCLGGALAIQLINLVRIVALFYTGVFFPERFEDSHIWIWQSIVILAGISLWVLWAHRYGTPRQRENDQDAA